MRTLMSRALTIGSPVTLGPATSLFSGESAALLDQRGFSVATERFLTLKDVPPAAGEGTRLLWIQNWRAASMK